MTAITNPHGIPDWLTRGIDYRKQAARRRLVILIYLSGAVTLIVNVWSLHRPAMNPLASVISAVYFIPLLYGGIVLACFAYPYRKRKKTATNWVADERQVAICSQTDRMAYGWLAAATAIALVLWDNAAKHNLSAWYPHSGDDFDILLNVYIVVSVTLPDALLAWREGDLLDEQEELNNPVPVRLQEEGSGKEKL